MKKNTIILLALALASLLMVLLVTGCERNSNPNPVVDSSLGQDGIGDSDGGLENNIGAGKGDDSCIDKDTGDDYSTGKDNRAYEEDDVSDTDDAVEDGYDDNPVSTSEPGSEEEPEENIDYVLRYPGIVMRDGNTGEAKVALTFDDGPDDIYTPEILDILEHYNVKATFFLTGIMLDIFPEVAARIYEDGHILANHGYEHVNFKTLTAEEIDINLSRNEELIKDITGEASTFFRPPYGRIDSRTIETIAGKGYSIVLWDVDSRDWEALTSEEILKNVLPHVKPGSIILQHSAGAPPQDLSGTVEALPVIIETLREQGYEFVLLDELIQGPSTRAVTQWHTVQPGETLYKIAMDYGIALERIINLNPMLNPDNIQINQRLVINVKG